MKTLLLLVAAALSGIITVKGQLGNAVPKNIRATNTLDNLRDANGLAIFDNLLGIPLASGTVVGNTFLNQDWQRTTFLLYDAEKMIEGFLSRYEIDQHQFEIQTAGGIRILHGEKVKSFVWLDSLTKTPHYFVNGRDMKSPENIPLTGFYEVLTEGSLTLLEKTDIVVKKATYNEKLDMGHRDTRIDKKTVFYYLTNNIVKPIPSGKKRLLAIFGEHASEMEEFIRINHLSLHEASHVRPVFEHYNKLMITN